MWKSEPPAPDSATLLLCAEQKLVWTKVRLKCARDQATYWHPLLSHAHHQASFASAGLWGYPLRRTPLPREATKNEQQAGGNHHHYHNNNQQQQHFDSNCPSCSSQEIQVLSVKHATSSSCLLATCHFTEFLGTSATRTPSCLVQVREHV